MSQQSRGKLGVNELCWCGSGQKYKKCHLGSSDAPRPQFHEAASVLLQNFRSYSKCHAPVGDKRLCAGRAIRAHSISKMSALSLIARKGHVYQPQTNPFELAKAKGQVHVRLLGVQNASVFYGFCSSHDASLFEEVDRNDCDLTSSAIFSLHYRAICKELSAKTPAVDSDGLLKSLDRGITERQQQALHRALDWREGITNLALGELLQEKDRLDGLLLREKYSELHSCVLTFECEPILACSGYLQPVFDFAGEVLQDMNDTSRRVYNQSLTVLPRGNGQVVILAWLPEAEAVCRSFANSLLALPDEKKATAVLRYVFNGCENFAVEPNWWEALSKAQREAIDEQMQEWIGPTPFFHLVDRYALKPEGVSLAGWSYISQTSR